MTTYVSRDVTNQKSRSTRVAFLLLKLFNFNKFRLTFKLLKYILLF